MTNAEKESLIDNFKELCTIERSIMCIDLDFSLSSSIECENELNQIMALVRKLKDKIKLKSKEPIV